MGYDIAFDKSRERIQQLVDNSPKTSHYYSDFAEVKTRFLIRTPKKVIEKDMFIKFKDSFYNISYINNYNFKDEYTEIMSELVVK